MWTWTCSKCGATFTRDEKADAQAAFFAHVTEKHRNATVVSLTVDA